MFLDDVEHYRRRGHEVRVGLLSRQGYSPEKLFPEYFSKTAESVEDDGGSHGENVEYDYSSVEWQAPSDADKQNLEKMLKLLQESSGTGRISAQQVMGQDDDGGGWV